MSQTTKKKCKANPPKMSKKRNSKEERFKEEMKMEKERIKAYNYDDELGESSSEEMEDDLIELNYNHYKDIKKEIDNNLIKAYDDDCELNKSFFEEKKDDYTEIINTLPKDIKIKKRSEIKILLKMIKNLVKFLLN